MTAPNPPQEFKLMVERGIAEGWITSPARSGLTPAVYYKASRSTMEVIDEDRG